MRQLEQVHNRRKAFIYVSNGYDLDPAKTRAKNEAERYGNCARQRRQQRRQQRTTPSINDPTLRNSSNQFAFADLVSDLAELTRAANRANTTIYTIDPRGLVGGPDLDEKIDMMATWTTSAARRTACACSRTGGLAVVNQNDFTKALKRIDQKTATTTWSATTRAIPIRRRSAGPSKSR